MRSIINKSELWLCEDTDQTKEKEVYENHCGNVINEVRLASRLTTDSNKQKAIDQKQNNTNRKWKNAPPRKNFQRI
jgi:hypothetical protein